MMLQQTRSVRVCDGFRARRSTCLLRRCSGNRPEWYA